MNIAQDEPTEERVRVLIDPKPPKKGRLTYDEYYDRMVVRCSQSDCYVRSAKLVLFQNKNMQEMEVDAATIEMAAPVRHVRMMTEDGPVMIAEPAGRIRRNRLIRSQSDRPHGARNLDWIIDAVARVSEHVAIRCWSTSFFLEILWLAAESLLKLVLLNVN